MIETLSVATTMRNWDCPINVDDHVLPARMHVMRVERATPGPSKYLIKVDNFLFSFIIDILILFH